MIEHLVKNRKFMQDDTDVLSKTKTKKVLKLNATMKS